MKGGEETEMVVYVGIDVHKHYCHIAFNILYNIFDPTKKGDKKGIKKLISTHPSKAKINRILSECDGTIRLLASKRLTDWHGLKDYSNELRGMGGQPNVRETLMTAGLCLWVVRNDVFHGGGTAGQDLSLIHECLQLLDRIYRDCFCDYVGLT
jgi:hypothetical protein